MKKKLLREIRSKEEIIKEELNKMGIEPVIVEDKKAKKITIKAISKKEDK